MTRSPGEDDKPVQTGGDDEAATWDKALCAAVDWGILLDDAPEDMALRDQFQIWLAADPQHRAAWAEASRVSSLIVQTKGIRPLPPARAANKTGLRPGRRTVAALAAAIALAWLAGPAVMVRATSDHRTGDGEQRLVTLDDGSQIRLAPASAIKVDYADDERMVALLTGEAYFDVARDHARPFQVAAGTATVTVLGTGFDVRLGSKERAEIAVHHGIVHVKAVGEPAGVVLTAGHWARIMPDGAAEQGEISPDMVGSWTDRRLTAVDRPLSEVVADLRRYYGGQVLLTDATLGARTVTGIFDMTDPLAAARLIVQPHGGVVRQITPWLMVISKS